MPTARTGTGTTITSADSGFTMKVIGVDPFSIELDEIDASNMSSEDFLEYIPADLAELGEMSVEVEYDGSVDILSLLGVVQAWEVDVAGRGAGHVIKATGFLKGLTATIPLNDKMTGTATIKWDGASFVMAGTSS
jgi:hypothetical protein